MLDFTPIKRGERAMNDLAAGLSLDDLRRLTEESVAGFEALLDGLDDADVTFVPDDRDANDPYAEDPADRRLPWTLAHVVVHATASAEEYAAVATGCPLGAWRVACPSTVARATRHPGRR